MTTAQEIVTDALESIGVYAPGETLSAADSSRALTVLNDMLDSWSNDNLAVFARTEVTKVLTANVYQYTIGAGGAINTTRPLRVLDGYGSAYVVDTNSNRFPIDVIGQDQWNLIGNVATVTSDGPTKLFYDAQYPLGTINLFPVPLQAWTLHFDTMLQLTDFAALGTTVSLPPGYNRAMKRNLALDLWPYFKGIDKQPPGALVRAAAMSLGSVKRTNTKMNMAMYDSALIGGVARTADIYRGTQGWS